MEGIETAAPGPEAPGPYRQEEAPFAVVAGEPVTELPRDLYIRARASTPASAARRSSSSILGRGRSTRT